MEGQSPTKRRYRMVEDESGRGEELVPSSPSGQPLQCGPSGSPSELLSVHKQRGTGLLRKT